MSWEEITKPIVPSSVAEDKVRITCYWRNARAKRVYICRFSIGATIAKNLQWPSNTTVKFLWGNGPDLGLVRIIPIINKKAGGFQVRIFHNKTVAVETAALLPNTPQINRKCDVESRFAEIDIAGVCYNFLEVRLPADFYKGSTNEDSDSRPAEIVSPPKPTATPQPTPVPVIQPKSTFQVNKPKSAPLSKPVPATTPQPPAWKPSTDTRLDIVGICQYITHAIGDRARVIDARLVRINDQDQTHSYALNYANAYRATQRPSLPPYQLRSPV